jgi:hypothetical protein
MRRQRTGGAASGGIGHTGAMGLAVVLLITCLAAGPIGAKTLRFASAFDPQSLDPHVNEPDLGSETRTPTV